MFQAIISEAGGGALALQDMVRGALICQQKHNSLRPQQAR